MSQNYKEDLEQIRSMMERSSRFISLSGFSGIFIGLVGCVTAFLLFKYQSVLYSANEFSEFRSALQSLFVIGAVSLITAVAGAVFFTLRKTKKLKLPFWSSVTKRILFSLLVPLAAGGIFCLKLTQLNLIFLVLPVTLIFYGLALLNTAKYTFRETAYLGLFELGLGLIALFLPAYSIWIWGAGFGIAHILYGLLVQRKYK